MVPTAYQSQGNTAALAEFRSVNLFSALCSLIISFNYFNLLHSKPSARVASLEALVIWVGNKPGEWLSSLPEDVSAAYRQDARKMVKEIKERTKKKKN